MSYAEWCPVCGEPIISVTRGIPSMGTCANGHSTDRRDVLRRKPVTPDPRIEGWNAAIEAAARLIRQYAVEKGNTKTPSGRTAIFYARKVSSIPCPYKPKEGKDDA